MDLHTGTRGLGSSEGESDRWIEENLVIGCQDLIRGGMDSRIAGILDGREDGWMKGQAAAETSVRCAVPWSGAETYLVVERKLTWLFLRTASLVTTMEYNLLHVSVHVQPNVKLP